MPINAEHKICFQYVGGMISSYSKDDKGSTQFSDVVGVLIDFDFGGDGGDSLVGSQYKERFIDVDGEGLEVYAWRQRLSEPEA